MLKMHVLLFPDVNYILVLPNIWALFTISLFDTECHNIRLCVLLRLGTVLLCLTMAGEISS